MRFPLTELTELTELAELTAAEQRLPGEVRCGAQAFAAEVVVEAPLTSYVDGCQSRWPS